jgi:hypothetical protein
MEPGKWALEEALAAIESETRHLVHAEARSTPTAETDVDIAPLVHKVGATSIAEIEKLIGELQEARDFLQSEGERVRRETERYTNLTQTASASVKIISDTVAGWRGAPVTWRIPQPVVAVQFDQVERVLEYAVVSAVVMDEIERGNAIDMVLSRLVV